MKQVYFSLCFIAFFLFQIVPVIASDIQDEQDKNHEMDSVVFFLDFPELIIPGPISGTLGNVPGSVKRIFGEDLRLSSPISANESLRAIPGLHLQDEEGAGLRINLGVRGLDPDRSRNILILEDGIPVALNPYGEPEMYYSPAIDRMSGLELIKGSGQILYGPQTIGGVLNYITPNPPDELSGQFSPHYSSKCSLNQI